MSFFNNGVRYPGADHVYVTYTTTGGLDTTTRCLHYYTGQNQGYELNLNQVATVTKVVWGPEC